MLIDTKIIQNLKFYKLSFASAKLQNFFGSKEFFTLKSVTIF